MTIERLRDEISALRLDESLLFLNHLLAVGRGETIDPACDRLLRARNASAPPFIIHFLAKQLLLYGSNLGPYPLDGRRFHRLMDLYFQLDDPICSDPNWPNADPSGFFERMLAQQLPSQGQVSFQPYGLGLGLFRDVGSVLVDTQSYDIRADIERELEMPFADFIAMGLLCSCAPEFTQNGYRCRGTFRPTYFAQANVQGFTFSQQDRWGPFLQRVSCDRDNFRRVYHSNLLYQAQDTRYIPFEFNPLRRFPVIDVGSGRYIAVDPHLLAERTTLGLFYDLFERHGTNFSHRFGSVFDRFVGNLLESVCPTDSLWWEADTNRPKPKNPGKVADWAYRGTAYTVLFECKSLRPSLELLTYGSDEHVRATRKRIVDALEQLIKHNASIQTGMWTTYGLPPAPVLGVVVTYGRIRGANSPFMQPRIAQDLADRHLAPIPYVVLSIEELDHVIRLVELGHQLDNVLLDFATGEPSFDLIQRYASAFTGQQGPNISAFSYSRGLQFMNGLHPVIAA